MSSNNYRSPEYLCRYTQFVCWAYEYREGNRTKVPKDGNSGKNASVTNSASWCTYEQAVQGVERYKFDGIGFVLAGNGIVAFDLDHCVDINTGEIDDWAKDIIHTLDSYTEYSPSWTGIRILAIGELPQGRRRKGKIEIYDNKRFVTITGRILDDGHNDIEERQHEILELYSKYLADQVTHKQIRNESPPELHLDDIEIIRKAEGSKSGNVFRRLWSGDWKGLYGSQSQADFALINHLIYWVGNDPQHIDKLFRQSGLYREKWERLGMQNINRALSTFRGLTYPELMASRGGKRSETKTG